MREATDRQQYNNRQNPPQRRKKRRRRNLSLYYLMIFILVVIVGTVLSLTVLFKVSDIKVVGATSYSAEAIASASGIKPGDNLIRISVPKAQEKILKQMLYIDKVEIKRQFPDKVIITVEPSIPFAYVEHEEQYCLVSRTGKILEEKAVPDGKHLIFKGYEPRDTAAGEMLVSSDENKEKLFTNISAELEKFEDMDVNEIDISDRFNIVFLCENRITVELGSQVDLDYKLIYAGELISTHIPKNKEGTIFIRNNNEASFVEKEDLERYEQNYINAMTAPTETSPDGEETSETASDNKPEE